MLLPLATVILAATSGCTYTARYDSEPAGATVYIDGVPKGVTPLVLELPNTDGGSYTLRVTLAGYEQITQVVSPVPDGGSMTLTNTHSTASVLANTHAQANVYNYGSLGASGRGTASTYATGTGTSTTITNTIPTYTWPTRFFFALKPTASTSPWAAPTPASTAAPASSGSRAAFCGQCGARLGAGVRFCAGCGARVGG